MPLLKAKFEKNLALHFPARQAQAILDQSLDQSSLEEALVNDYVDLYLV
jgi:2-methylcitrate dehydratase PrpD